MGTRLHMCAGGYKKYEQVQVGTQIEVGIRMQADATAQADIRAGKGMRMQGYSSKTSEHKGASRYEGDVLMSLQSVS